MISNSRKDAINREISTPPFQRTKNFDLTPNIREVTALQSQQQNTDVTGLGSKIDPIRAHKKNTAICPHPNCFL